LSCNLFENNKVQIGKRIEFLFIFDSTFLVSSEDEGIGGAVVLIPFQFESSLFLGDLLAEVEEDNTRAYHIVEDTHPSCIQEREEACNFH
jgi:hypothetical protein